MPELPKWEYLLLEIDVFGPGRRRVRYINEHEVEKWKQGMPLPEHLNALGDEGWELVTFQLVTDQESKKDQKSELVLKRLKRQA